MLLLTSKNVLAKTNLIFILLFFLGTNLIANTPPTILVDDFSKIDIINNTRTYKDSTGQLNFSQIRTGDYLKENHEKIYMTYGESGATWISFSLENKTSQSSSFLIEIPNATINIIEFYRQNVDGSYERILTGDAIHYEGRDVPTRYFTFNVNIPKDEIKTYYVRVEPQGDAINVPIMVWEPLGYIEQNLSEKYAYGLYYGAMTFIILFHIFLFFKLKDVTLIYYMLYVSGITLLQLGFDGLFSKFLLPSVPWVADRAIPAPIFLASFSVVFFIQQYLDTKNTIPKYNYFLHVIKWLNIALFVMTFIPIESFYLLVIGVMSFVGIFANLSVVIGAVLAFKKKPRLAKYFIIAYIMLLTGVFLSVLQNMGYPSFITKYAIKLGSSGEMIVLAFALAVRFKMIDEQTQAMLEALVEERTAELRQSNKNINDSIRYAKRIQDSLLPNEDALKDIFAEYFIFFKPKDVVSGDFYWHQQKNGKFMIASADCTGHGVPGAFMSMLGSTLLKEIVDTQSITQPAEILKKLDYGIVTALKQDSNLRNSSRDGMDISLLTYDSERREVNFAGAKRPILYYDGEKMETIKGSRFSIGGKKSEKMFKTESIKVKNGDMIYMFSDGYPDQFGGAEDRKFMVRRLKELLEIKSQLPMDQQKEEVQNAFNTWKGGYKQTDDVLVMGLKF